MSRYVTVHNIRHSTIQTSRVSVSEFQFQNEKYFYTQEYIILSTKNGNSENQYIICRWFVLKTKIPGNVAFLHETGGSQVTMFLLRVSFILRTVLH